MKVLFDTNVILDVLLNREEFIQLSASLVNFVETKKIEGFLCATTLTTIDYLVTKTHNKKTSKFALKSLLSIFQVSQVNKSVLEFALNSNFKDFEDAVQYYSGKCAGINCVVTRNTKDYKKTKLPIYTPTELWSILQLKI